MLLWVVVYAPTGPGASFSETPFSRHGIRQWVCVWGGVGVAACGGRLTSVNLPRNLIRSRLYRRQEVKVEVVEVKVDVDVEVEVGVQVVVEVVQSWVWECGVVSV